MIKKLLNVSKLIMALAVVLLSTTDAMAYGNSMYNVYNSRVQAYPAGAGKIYICEESDANPTDDQYVDAMDYKSVVYDDDSKSVHVFAQPSADNKLVWGGWLQADSVEGAYSFDNVNMLPDYLNIDCVSSFEDEDEANAALAADPTNNIYACWVAVKAKTAEGYSSLGSYGIDKLINNFGDEVTVYGQSLNSDVKVDYFLVNGEKVEPTDYVADMTMTADNNAIKLNVTEGTNVEVFFTSPNLYTIEFAEEGEYKIINIPAGHEARIINYEFEGVRIDSYSFKSDFNYIWSGNSVNTYLAGGSEGCTYLVYGKGTHKYYVYEDAWQSEPVQTYLKTASKAMTLAANEDVYYYTFDGTQFVYAPYGKQIKAGEAYLALPKASITNRKAAITLRKEKLVEPTKPAPSFTEPEYEPLATDGATVQYLYNAEFGGFMLGANDWTTRASVSREKGYQFKVKLNEDGKYTLNDSVETRDIKWSAVFAENAESIWVDNLGGKNVNAWEITALENGKFTIQNTAAAAGNLSVVPSKNDTRLYLSSEEGAMSTWGAVNDSVYNAHLLVLAEEAEEYNKKVAEYDSLKAAYDAEVEELTADPSDITAQFPNIDPSKITTGGWTIPTDWTIDPAIDNNGAFHVNTWSSEGNTDGTNVTVPFFERWVGGGATLNPCKMSTSLDGLTPGAYYDLSSLFRVVYENGGVAVDKVNFFANDAVVDVCEQCQPLTNGSLANKGVYGDVELRAKADAEGKLTIGVEVLEGTNASWVVWKKISVRLSDLQNEDPTNLDFESSTACTVNVRTYAKDVTGDEVAQLQEVEGWDIAVENGDARAAAVYAYGSQNFLGGAGYLAPATAPEGSDSKNALGISAVWSATAQYTQKVSLPAGYYMLYVPVYNSGAGKNDMVKNLIGFIANDGEEHLAQTKSYASDQWTNEAIMFQLDTPTDGVLSLGFAAPNAGTAGNHHLFIDAVKLSPLTAGEYYGAELAAAIAKAEAELAEAMPLVGADLFLYTKEGATAYQAVIDDAKAVAANAEATADEIKAAIKALPAASTAFAAAKNLPSAAPYIVKNVKTGLYLNADTLGITINEAKQEFTFEAAEGGYYLKSGEYYVGLEGNNNWTMSAAADKKAVITVVPQVVDSTVVYLLKEAKGAIGTDGAEAGATCYADKNAEKNGLWSFELVKISLGNFALKANTYVGEDGWYDVRFTYTGKINDDTPDYYLSSTLYYTLKKGEEVVKENAPASFDLTKGDAGIWFDDLTPGEVYTITLNKVEILDYSNADWETNFGDVAFSQTENLPSLTFTVPVAKVTIDSLSLAADKAFDEDGWYAVRFNYNGQILDETPDYYLSSSLKYTLKKGDEVVVNNLDASFDLTSGTSGIWREDFEPNTEYTLTVNSITVIDYSNADWETNFGDVILYKTEDLPSVTFTTPAKPKVYVGDITLAAGEDYDEEGWYGVSMYYNGGILDETPEYYLNSSVTYTLTKGDSVVVEDVDASFDITAGVAGIWRQDFEPETEYTITINSIKVIDYSNADWETNFGDTVFYKRETLATLTFTTPEKSELICRLYATPAAGYETFCASATFEEYSDKIVIKGYDGIEGNDLTIKWDETGYTTINGEASPWITMDNEALPYYGAYLYATEGYTGGNWTAEEGGSFWIGGYFYKDVNDAGTWNYMYWTLSKDAPTAISSVSATALKADGKFIENGKVVIIRNGIKYNLNGVQIIK